MLHISGDNYCSGNYRRVVLACVCIDAGLRRIDSAEKCETIAVYIRIARIMAWPSGESCYLSFDPITNSYTMNGSRYVNIPEGIRFDTDSSVKGKTTEPGEMPPADGITYESEGIKNCAHFHPKGTVIPTGAL